MRGQRGVTLIELVVSIAVIAIAALALLGTLGYVHANSGLTMLQAQAQTIANAYLTEITHMPFVDPDGIDGESSRCLFDDVNDYNGLDDLNATDRCGNVVAPFRVRVSVTGAALNGITAANSMRVDVTVDYAPSAQAVATGYRTNY
ncbi:MAG TPA: prepilin-type N-terminal cleavage/methylation domain-containing protein [Steroidobacteraceae bacterium]|jgi:MSHA pilin protein MshD|nr:prepilin-type N-terminal cleavage/methylation domain-containing protein [Steroidobacteraceae bacterium]